MNWPDIYRSLGKPGGVLEILETNQESQKYDLVLTTGEALEIIEARNKAVKGHGRIELGMEVITKIITAFCRSPYISREDYALTINELIDLFYYTKNETEDLIGDDELVTVMKEFFNGSCKGSLELLRNRELVLFARDFRNGLLKSVIHGEEE